MLFGEVNFDSFRSKWYHELRLPENHLNLVNLADLFLRI